MSSVKRSRRTAIAVTAAVLLALPLLSLSPPAALALRPLPTSALDWAHGEQVVQLLREAAHQRGATVLVVSHDARIIPFVDQVLHIEDGCLLDSGQAATH